ncbi:MAG: inorganic phosphate transporter, partial [Pseudomonas sp.]
MATPSFTAAQAPASSAKPQLDKKPGLLTIVIFFAVLGSGLLFTAYSLMHDMNELGTVVTTWTPFLLLGVALLIALGFEFVNGFHDTANAVATVIYTNSLPPNFAVAWSGFFNFLGVLLSSGAVAFGIIALLPVELILQVGSSAGFAMIFALLIAAILWNLGTWWLGLPASSSHTLIGSIIGVGVANALMHGR